MSTINYRQLESECVLGGEVILQISRRNFKTQKSQGYIGLTKSSSSEDQSASLPPSPSSTATSSSSSKLFSFLDEAFFSKYAPSQSTSGPHTALLHNEAAYRAGMLHMSESYERLLRRLRLRKFLLWLLAGGCLGLGASLYTRMARDNAPLFKLLNGSHWSPERTEVRFDDVRGCDAAKAELETVVEFLRSPTKFTDLGARLPRGVLLEGQPGVGKTLLAKAVAGQAGVVFLQASGSEFEEMFVGVGSSRIRKLFAIARANAPCLVFIDEIDSIGRKRTSSNLHPYANQTINQLLSEMDGFRPSEGIIVLGSTNRKSSLDSALLRPGRFDLSIHMDYPDFKGRVELLELYLSKTSNQIASDSAQIVSIANGTIGMNGADIRNMVNQAAILAGSHNRSELTIQDIWEARDKIVMGPAKQRIADAETNRITAYHEAGHALVSFYTPGAIPLHKVTIIPRGASLGQTVQLRKREQVNHSVREYQAMLDVAMGGRVAEELTFGPDRLTSGSSSDLDKATKIARTMVEQLGMSAAELGPRRVQMKVSSEATRQRVDSEVQRLLVQAEERARRLLQQRSAELSIVGEALLERETLSRQEIVGLLGSSGAGDVDLVDCGVQTIGPAKLSSVEKESKSTDPPLIDPI